MGHVICQDGLKPDPDKVQGIREMPAPTSKQDLKIFLGMVNYLQKFAPNLSEVTAPMRDLLKQRNVFRIFLSVLRDGFMASVTWRPRLIQIRLPCAKRLGDVLRFLLLKRRERC